MKLKLMTYSVLIGFGVICGCKNEQSPKLEPDLLEQSEPDTVRAPRTYIGTFIKHSRTSIYDSLHEFTHYEFDTFIEQDTALYKIIKDTVCLWASNFGYCDTFSNTPLSDYIGKRGFVTWSMGFIIKDSMIHYSYYAYNGGTFIDYYGVEIK